VDWFPVLKPGEFWVLQRLTRSHQTFAPSNRFVSECRKPSPPLSEPLHHQQLRLERPKKSFHAEEAGCIGYDNNSSSGQPMALSRDHQSCQLQRLDQQQRQKYQDEGLIRTELLNAARMPDKAVIGLRSRSCGNLGILSQRETIGICRYVFTIKSNNRRNVTVFEQTATCFHSRIEFFCNGFGTSLHVLNAHRIQGSASAIAHTGGRKGRPGSGLRSRPALERVGPRNRQD
jgi:hypothetical protein